MIPNRRDGRLSKATDLLHVWVQPNRRILTIITLCHSLLRRCETHSRLSVQRLLVYWRLVVCAHLVPLLVVVRFVQSTQFYRDSVRVLLQLRVANSDLSRRVMIACTLTPRRVYLPIVCAASQQHWRATTRVLQYWRWAESIIRWRGGASSSGLPVFGSQQILSGLLEQKWNGHPSMVLLCSLLLSTLMTCGRRWLWLQWERRIIVVVAVADADAVFFYRFTLFNL